MTGQCVAPLGGLHIIEDLATSAGAQNKIYKLGFTTDQRRKMMSITEILAVKGKPEQM